MGGYTGTPLRVCRCTPPCVHRWAAAVQRPESRWGLQVLLLEGATSVDEAVGGYYTTTPPPRPHFIFAYRSGFEFVYALVAII